MHLESEDPARVALPRGVHEAARINCSLGILQPT
jgi:hypothetical protein